MSNIVEKPPAGVLASYAATLANARTMEQHIAAQQESAELKQQAEQRMKLAKALEHEAWLNNPRTKDLLAYIESTYDNCIARLLAKHATTNLSEIQPVLIEAALVKKFLDDVKRGEL